LAAAANVTLAFLAYFLHRRLWRRPGFCRDWSAAIYNALAFGLPVALATAPSFFLSDYGGKPFFVIVAVLTSDSLSLTTTLKNPELNIDPALARSWFVIAVTAILSLLTPSVAGMADSLLLELRRVRSS
jgi:hypothetical protein